jgi:phytoene dehydrogenase-like protein
MGRTVDAVVVGSGHNGLVAAAYLAQAGWEVEILERNPVAGGLVATEQLTQPGYLHDTFSSWHPLFQLSGAFAELGDELRARGLEYLNTDDVVTASVPDDGEAVLGYRDAAKTASAFGEPDGPTYLRELGRLGGNMDLLGELLGTELYSPRVGTLATKLVRRLGVREGLAFPSGLTASGRAWLGNFQTPEPGTLLSPWVLHTGLSPDDAGGAFQMAAIAGALHEVGLPVVKGGSANFVRAFTALIADHGGVVRTGVEVQRVIVEGGQAVGVATADEEIRARHAVIANVTPTQLYGRLLQDGAAPERAREQAAAYRYNPRAGTQIHLALSEPARWRDPRLNAVPLVHVTGGMEGVSLGSAQARAGLLPAEPTVAVGQQATLDPSRVPAGKGMIWIQLQDVPYRPRGDAAGQIDVGDGTWTPELTEAYADRVVARVAAHVENLPDAIVGRAVLSPAELERRNPNLVRGDIYAGATDLDQSFLWRPLPSYGSHATPVDRLYQIGASTYPGPGLNAASGRIVARQLLRRPPVARLRQAVQGVRSRRAG